MSRAALEAEGLCRYYGPHIALEDVDLAVAPGEWVVLLGANGAGKSTLLALFSTLLRPSAGAIRIHGVDPRRGDAAPLRRRLGYVAHRTFAYDELTGFENLVFHGRLHDLADPRAAARRALEEGGLADRGDDRVGSYSRGMQQRLAIARALLHEPDILLLDEPFSGLDRPSASALEARLAAARDRGTACVMATHDLAAALRAADRIAVLADGRLVLDRPARGLDAALIEAALEPGRTAAAARAARP